MSVDPPVYSELEPSQKPFWNTYLWELQQKAPKPRRIKCDREITHRPSHYGREFHGAISREAADALVSECDGCYLIRESQRSPGCYTLTMRFNERPMNFRLYYDGMHYVSDKRFETIQDLVEDGLINMYIQLEGKDHINMMMNQAPPEAPKRTSSCRNRSSNNDEKKVGIDEGKTEEDGLTVRKFSVDRRDTFKPSAVSKAHNFKMYTFKGPHWCDHCRNFLWGLIMQGLKCQDCGFNAHKQCIKVVGNNCQPDKKYVKRVFGVDLTTLVKAHDTKRPVVVDMCIKEVEKRGIDSEGIYRVSGFADDVEALKNSFDKDGANVDVSPQAYEDINTITGCLKLYFRMLPLPLITFETYKSFIEAAKIQDHFQRMNGLSQALAEVPQAHYETLKFLMIHLEKVSKLHSKNMMTPENLSIVFGPTLMRSPKATSLESLTELKYQRLVVEHLISEQGELFT